MGKKPKKGAFTWTCGKEKLLAVSWVDKKVMNIMTNLFEKPGNAGYKNGIPVPNFIATYRSTLGYVDQANAFRLRYRFRHRILKHTRAQFISIFFLAIVNSWVLYKHVNKKMEFTYREFFRELIESLGQAGGRHRKRRRTERASPTTATAAAATTTAAATAAAATAAAAAATAAAAPSMTAPTSNVHMLETAVKRGRCVVCRNPNHCRRFCVGCSPNVDDLVYLHDECFASHHCVTDLLSRFASAIKKKNDIKTPSLSA